MCPKPTESIIRIVSLLPSATELIHAVLNEARSLGQASNINLVGRSHECDWPPEYGHLPTLTASNIDSNSSSADIDQQVREQLAAGKGLYSVNKALLKELKPNVIVTQSLCKVCSVDFCLVEDFTKELQPRPALVDTNPTSIEEVLRDIIRVGNALNLKEAAQVVVESLQKRINAAVAVVESKKAGRQPKVGFCEWIDPIFCGGHWTPQLIEMAGGYHPLNPAKERNSPSVAFTNQEFVATDPDVIIVACCGFDIPRTLKELEVVVSQDWWKGMRAVQEDRVYVVDGNQMFNRPGPRVVDAFEWLVSVLQDAPDLCPHDFPVIKLTKESHSE